MSTDDRNTQLFERAQRTIPGGVNSPVRAFGAVGGTPRFVERALGPHFWDSNGQQFIDYIGSWGSMILGHTHPEVVQAMMHAAQQGLSFGAPTEREIVMAERLSAMLPSMAMVRMVSSGTEATMSAIRLARGFTGRSKIIKFEGCYHGHADSLLVKAGSGALTFGHPTSAGVPAEIAAHTMVLDFNDAQQISDAFKQHGDAIACVIVEPIAGNMNLIKPVAGYLQTLRELCTQYGAVLIFDEVMTGFRVGPRGVQGLYDVTPDLTTLGKIIGGGMPAAAFGGRADIMRKVAPLGSVYQAGTLSGNPVALAAGLKTLDLISAPGFYERLSEQTSRLVKGLVSAAHKHQHTFCADSVGGMFGFYFADSIPTSFKQVTQSDRDRFNQFFHASLQQGLYWAPSAYEAGFVSITHTHDIIDHSIQLAEKAFASLDA